MATINHRVGIKASPEDIYQALTTNEGLSRWWTNDVSGAGPEGAVITFQFGQTGVDFEVAELQPNRSVRWWHSGEIPGEWKETEVLFQLQQDGDQTFVNFSHSNWKKPTNLFAHCSTKWAVFLLSLKDALEQGQGQPYPNDRQIDHS